MTAGPRRKLASGGRSTRREITLAVLVLIAFALWIFGGGDHERHDRRAGGDLPDAAHAGRHLGRHAIEQPRPGTRSPGSRPWSRSPDGLARTGFVKWFAKAVAAQMTGFSPTWRSCWCLVFFFTHYMFASVTAHTTAMMPVMLAVGSTIPGMPMETLALCCACSWASWGSSRPTGPDRARCTTEAAICQPATTGAWGRSSASSSSPSSYSSACPGCCLYAEEKRRPLDDNNQKTFPACRSRL